MKWVNKSGRVWVRDKRKHHGKRRRHRLHIWGEKEREQRRLLPEKQPREAKSKACSPW